MSNQICSEPLVWTCKACGHSFHEAEWESSHRKCPACNKTKGRWKCSLCQEDFPQPALGQAHPCYREETESIDVGSKPQPALSKLKVRLLGRFPWLLAAGALAILLVVAGSVWLKTTGNFSSRAARESTPKSPAETESRLPAYEFALYENRAFDFRVEYPLGLLFPRGDPEDPDGARFVSQDETISLVVHGSVNAPPLSLNQAMEKETSSFENPSREVLTKEKGSDYFLMEAREGNRNQVLKQILRNGKWRKLRLAYPSERRSQIAGIVQRVTASFRATDAVMERPKMYFFYHPDLKRIYDSEFFDGEKKIGVPPESGPFVYQPDSDFVRISNMNRNRMFGNTYGGVFYEGKAVPGQVYVFRNDFFTGSWRRLSNQEAISLLRENGISVPKSSSDSSGSGTDSGSPTRASSTVPQGNRKVSKLLKLPEYTGTPHTDQLDRPTTP